MGGDALQVDMYVCVFKRGQISVYCLWVMLVMLWDMVEGDQSCLSNAPLHMK